MSEENKESTILNLTDKFAVLDVPGISQSNNNNNNDNDDNVPTNSSNKEGKQGRRAKASTGPRMDDSTTTLIGGSSFTQRTNNPQWIQSRQEIYTKINERRATELASKKHIPIQVTMPDGKVMDKDMNGEEYMAWKTSPYDVAATISQGLADSAVVARVTYENYVDDYNLQEDGMDGEDLLADSMDIDDDDKDAKAILWDMTRPLVGNVSKLELLKFDSDQDAKTVFWHSSAHMLGEALEHLYGCRLTIGPPLKGGFYYDSFMGSDAFNENDCKYIYTYILDFSCRCMSYSNISFTNSIFIYIKLQIELSLHR